MLCVLYVAMALRAVQLHLEPRQLLSAMHSYAYSWVFVGMASK